MSIAQLEQRQLILFDLDGTLVDSAHDLYRAMNMSLNIMQLPSVTEEQVRVWIGKGSSLFCESVLRHLVGKVMPAQHQELLSTFLEIYNADPCIDTVPFPGILEFLAWAKAEGKTLICVTNKPERPACSILDTLKMSQYFTDTIGGDRFAERKPHPRQLLHCVEHYQVAKEQVLLIGDSCNDIEAARRAGIDCIVVSYGYNHGEDIADSQPQQIVSDLRDLLN